jgi:hypothetical protein
MGQIFISYSKKDVVHAEKLINALKREGFDPWVDMEGLHPGTYWRERLEKQIKNCDAYLLIISRNSKKSKWVREELEEARNQDKPIFTLRLDQTRPFFGIRGIQYEDIRGGKLPSEEFYQRLADVTERKKRTRRKANRTDRAKKQVREGTAELLSYFGEEFLSTGKDLMAVATKKSSEAYKSVVNSDAVKRLSASVKKTTTSEKKTATSKRKKTTRKKRTVQKKKK